MRALVCMRISTLVAHSHIMLLFFHVQKIKNQLISTFHARNYSYVHKCMHVACPHTLASTHSLHIYMRVCVQVCASVCMRNHCICFQLTINEASCWLTLQMTSYKSSKWIVVPKRESSFAFVNYRLKPGSYCARQ